MTARQDESTIDERLTKVDDAIRQYLEKYYENISFEVFHERARVVFGSDDEEPYIRFHIVFDGKFSELENRRIDREIGRVRDLLSAVGISEFPVLSYVSKADWKRYRHRMLAGA